MNQKVTSREEILSVSRELVKKEGSQAISIRSVAGACGVSVGSIYNYFGSKTKLLAATVESIWNDIFHRPEDEAVFRDTLACVRWMYRQLEYGCAQYPGFFTHHSLGFMHQGTADGKQQMQQAWQHILRQQCFVLQQDPNVRPDAFNDQFTAERFAGVLFSQMLSALVQQDFDPSMVLEIVRRAIY